MRGQDTEEAGKRGMWDTGSSVQEKEMERVGVGGHQSRGHSDDVGATSRGSRSGQKSFYCNKEQPDSAAAQQRKGLPQVASPTPQPR